MDNVLLMENIFDALVFVMSSIIFTFLYGTLDKKYHFTNKIFNGVYKWEWVIHIVISLILISVIHYLGTYIFSIPNVIVALLIGAIAGIGMYNSNRHDIL